jgi:hypothetical protein
MARDRRLSEDEKAIRKELRKFQPRKKRRANRTLAEKQKDEFDRMERRQQREDEAYDRKLDRIKQKSMPYTRIYINKAGDPVEYSCMRPVCKRVYSSKSKSVPDLTLPDAGFSAPGAG